MVFVTRSIRDTTRSIKILVIGLAVASLSGCSGADKAFVAEQRAMATGYRLEYFDREKLLFIHYPDGEKRGIDLAKVKRVALRRVPGRETVDGKPRYFWDFQTPDIVVSFPFFAVEPETVTSRLRNDLPAFDEPAALQLAKTFGRNRAGYCQVWVSAEHLKEPGVKKEDTCRS